MKQSKLFFLSIGVTAVLSSCGNIMHRMTVPAGVNNAVYLPAKSAKLTSNEIDNWQHAELSKDSIPGMSLEKAYKFIADKEAKDIVVAVIDSGQDIDHEDLINNIWTNNDEIPNNGIDDDNNGFIDDINGWNFLGSTYDENLEITRMVKMYEEEFKNKNVDQLSKVEKSKYNKYIALKAEVDKQFASSKSVYYDLDFHKSSSDLKQKGYNYDLKIYGDNEVRDAKKGEAHGTHVAGIIAANRSNDKGMKGVLNNVKIMAVRVVPNGDEYDKDVAMGIRYAVDNGAKVINMSFGKGYSPNKEWVTEAFKYAEKNDVLIIHSAGNSAQNIDVDHTYPNDAPDYKEEKSNNVLTIGALNPVYSEDLIAGFSNYGPRSVDIFAPGVQIYSTTPNNEYKHFSGTSMASPATAGVAALVRSYYPRLSARQVKQIIMNSGTKISKDVKVPGRKDSLKPFSLLSVSGRIVNAYNALVMAHQMTNG